MTTTTRKAWFIRKAEGGFFAVARNIDTGTESMVGPWGRPLPTVEATREYIASQWHDGTDFPGSIIPSAEMGEPSEFLLSHCLADLC